MKRSLVLSMGFILLFLLGACCSSLPTRLERDYGSSVRFSRANQTLNPEAAQNLDPVAGLDGKAAQANMDKYRKAFGEPAEPRQYIFQLGGASK